jgi:transposase InsO family protein
MNSDVYPLQWLLLTFAGWVNRHQQQVIEYLLEENWILKEQPGGRRLRLTDEQRRRLAAKGVRLGSFMAQVARNLTDAVDGFLLDRRFLICDRDAKFSKRFKTILETAGVELVRTPYQAPNCNAYAERFIRSLRDECLDRMILCGESSLRRVLTEYLAHYRCERNHQGLGNQLIERRVLPTAGHIKSRERLGGLLRYYYRAA